MEVVIKSEIIYVFYKGEGFEFQNGVMQKLSGKNVSYRKFTKAQAVLGVLESHLIVVSKTKSLPYIFGKKVHKIEEVTLIIEKGKAKNFELEKTLNQFVSDNNLFFSWEYNFSNTFEDSLNEKETNLIYNWNHRIKEDLPKNARMTLCPIVVNGSYQFCSIKQKNNEYKIWMIGRKDWRRSSRKNWRRGLDVDGNCANFFELEQIVSTVGRISTFVHYRGSIPLFWTSYPFLNHDPKELLVDNSKVLSSFEKSFEPITNFPKAVILNLVNKEGKKCELVDKFGELTRQSKLNLVYRANNFNNCNKYLVVPKVPDIYKAFGFDEFLKETPYSTFTWTDIDSIVLKSRQSVTFRTNCIDSNDRTNLMNYLLQRQMLYMALSDSGETLKEINSCYYELENDCLYRDTYYAFGEDLSLTSPSTNTMRGAVIVDQHHSWRVHWSDWRTKIVRYFYINFFEGYQIECQDVFLKNLPISQKQSSSRSYTFIVYYLALIIFSFFSVSMLNLSSDSFSIFLKIIFFIAFYVVLSFIGANLIGEYVVVRPTRPDNNLLK